MKRRAMRPTGRDLRHMAASFSAPILGWNTRDNFVSMDPRFARVLDNMIVDGGRLAVRKGFVSVAKSNFSLFSLAAYDYGAEKKLFASGNGGIYEVDFAENKLTPLGSDFLADKWNSIFYKGNLYFLNGQDPVQVYSAGELKAAEFTKAETEPTELDLKKLKSGTLYKNRLFFLERESLAFWHTENAGNVQGPLRRFDLAQIAKYGGSLQAVISWTYSVSSGAQESQIIFISSEGEVFVYAGTDPNEISTWALRGTYKIPRPVGEKCVCSLGGDVVYLGEDGYYKLSQLLSAPESEKATAFSDAINPTLQDLKGSLKNYGWKVQPYQADGLLFINVPQTGANVVQHVMNLQTGAWSRFTGMNAFDWAELGGNLYFCGPGGVYQAQTGQNDDGGAILWEFMGAYGNLGTAYAKVLKEVQLYYQGMNEIIFNLNVSVDFKRPYVAYRSNMPATQSKWDLAEWDKTPWAAEAAAVRKRIIPRVSQGGYFSFGCNGNLIDCDIKILGFDVLFERSKNLA